MAYRKTKYTLSPSEEDRICIEFSTDKKRIINFVIQFYAKTPKGWRTIRRYDCAHRYLHIHVFGYSRKKQKHKQVIEGDYNELFTELRKDLLQNMRRFKENYMFQ